MKVEGELMVNPFRIEAEFTVKEIGKRHVVLTFPHRGKTHEVTLGAGDKVDISFGFKAPTS